MKNVCIVENNVVTNVIVIEDDADASDFGAVDLGEHAGIGDTVIDGEIDNTDYVASEKRAKRDELLQNTDWWAVSDRTMTQAQIDYRQALRDLPEQDGFPDVDLPVYNPPE